MQNIVGFWKKQWDVSHKEIGLVVWSILIQRFKYRTATRWQREHVRQLLSEKWKWGRAKGRGLVRCWLILFFGNTCSCGREEANGVFRVGKMQGTGLKRLLWCWEGDREERFVFIAKIGVAVCVFVTFEIWCYLGYPSARAWHNMRWTTPCAVQFLHRGSFEEKEKVTKHINLLQVAASKEILMADMSQSLRQFKWPSLWFRNDD